MGPTAATLDRAPKRSGGGRHQSATHGGVSGGCLPTLRGVGVQDLEGADDGVAEVGGFPENGTELREIQLEMHADNLPSQGAQDGLQEREEEFADGHLTVHLIRGASAEDRLEGEVAGASAVNEAHEVGAVSGAFDDQLEDALVVCGARGVAQVTLRRG